MLNLVISEFERLWSMRLFKLLALLFIFISGFSVYFLTLFDIGLYTAESDTPLNAVNFPWFLLREVSFFITLFFMPLLYVIVLNSSLKSRAYKLILYRPYKKKLRFWYPNG